MLGWLKNTALVIIIITASEIKFFGNPTPTTHDPQGSAAQCMNKSKNIMFREKIMVEKIELANGLTIVLEEIPFVRSISFGFWVKNGSRNERPEENGISHFIEHMMFKGTKNRSAKQIADETDAIGGQLNAYTSKEHTCYYTRVLDTHFDLALEILADMFFNSSFDDAEIEKERNVIIEEINMYEDTPEDLVHDILQGKTYAGNPLGSPILGTKKSIANFRHDDFIKYIKTHYSPRNTVVAIAGNFKTPEMIKKIEKYFADYSSEDSDMPGFDSSYTKAVVSAEKKIEQLHVCLAFPGIALDSDMSYALSAFNALFGGGMSSRLFRKIREDKGLVYSIYSYSQSYVDTGLFLIYAALNPLQAGDAVKYILEEIRDVKRDDISDTQLERTKEQLKSNYVLSLESSAARMSSIGRSQLLLKRILTPDDVIAKIDRVEKQDIKRLTDTVLDVGSMSISAVGRLKNIDLEGLISGK